MTAVKMQTVRLGFNGDVHEVEMTAKAARDYAKQFAALVKDGKQIRSSESTAIRAWALENGVEIGDRGRISAQVRDAFKAGDVEAAKAAVAPKRSETLGKVREWAAEQGIPVAARGQVAASAILAYAEAQQAKSEEQVDEPASV